MNPWLRRSLHLVCVACLALLSMASCSSTDDREDTGTDGLASVDSAEPACGGQILVGQATNARDLGGQPLEDGSQVACRKVMRGGDLGKLTEQGCAEFAELGIRTVIDLREADVQAANGPPACVTNQSQLVSASMPQLLPDNPGNYLSLLDQRKAIAKVFTYLGEARQYPIYIHCEIGRDRASFVSALVLLALGASRDTVIEEFKLSELAGVPVQQPCIEAVLDGVKKLGGIDAYLDSLGVTAAQLGALRAEARAP